jgi:kynurenine formamidase
MARWPIALLVIPLAGCGAGVDEPASQPSVVAAPAKDSAQFLTNGSLIDLTHPFDERTVYWPTENGFVLELGINGVTEKGYYYAANRFRAAEHGGTHVDAPIHFHDQRHTVDQIELERLVGEAVVVDVSAKCAADPDYQIGVADLQAWEQQHGRQLVDVVVLLRTDWSKHWPDRNAYLGTDLRGPEAVALLHFPGLDPQAAQWLVEHRAPKSVGIDTASIDYGQSTHFEAHQTLCMHNVPGFENVAYLDQLPTAGALVMALPMKIAGGSGGPLRIVAWVREPAAERQSRSWHSLQPHKHYHQPQPPDKGTSRPIPAELNQNPPPNPEPHSAPSLDSQPRSEMPTHRGFEFRRFSSSRISAACSYFSLAIASSSCSCRVRPTRKCCRSDSRSSVSRCTSSSSSNSSSAS